MIIGVILTVMNWHIMMVGAEKTLIRDWQMHTKTSCRHKPYGNNIQQQCAIQSIEFYLLLSNKVLEKYLLFRGNH